MNEIAGAEQTLGYWFGPLSQDGLPVDDRFAMWFGRDSTLDAEIAQRFGAQLAAASAGKLNHWCDGPSGRLALIITLDQFSRNIFRDSPAAFANDPQALSLAMHMIEHASDRTLPWIQRAFVYMPLEHAEDSAVQERSVRCFEALSADASAAADDQANTLLYYARRHREIISRFGRFPHRNSVLGRTSTPQERAFLEEPDSSF